MDNKRPITIAIAVALAVLLFIVDLSLPVGYADWLFYFVPFFLAARELKRRSIPLLALITALLIIASYFLSPQEGKRTWAAVNCGMGILILCWFAFITMKHKQAEHALAVSYQELEQRVRERTGELSRANESLTREIVERTRAEESRTRTMQELERSNKELEQFARVVSHDLREPLRSVAGFAELLSQQYQGKLDDTADRYISYMRAGADRMTTLINDLLQYSRIGAMKAQTAEVEMEQAFDGAVENLKRAIEESNAVLTHDSLPTVFGDTTQLIQLLQNLIENALKFRKKKTRPRIHVSAQWKDGQWLFGVRDNGIGIDPAFHERIFQIFQRLHGREDYPGTGVGLAICMKIVERYGGRIWVESNPGEGSTFYFTLPGERSTKKSA